MSIATTVRTAGPFAGTGSLVALPFAFKVFTASDLVVQRTNVAGDVATLTLTTHYSVSLNADQDTSPGGTVTLVTALAVGETAALTSGVSATQPLQLASGGPFLPGQIEDALDRAMIVVQQQGVLGEQTLRVPLGETVAALPAATARASKLLGFDAGGSPQLYSADPELVTLWANVLAPGDGVADDTARIQAAITAAPNGEVELGAGGVFLSGPLTIPHRMTFRISGTLRMRDATGTLLTITGDDVTLCGDGLIDLNETQHRGVHVTGDRARVHDLTFANMVGGAGTSGASSALNIDSCASPFIHNLKFKNIQHGTAPSPYVSQPRAMSFDTVSNLALSDVVCEDVYCAAAVASVTTSEIRGLSVWNSEGFSADNALYIIGSSDVLISDPRIKNWDGEPIVFSGCNRIRVQGGEILDTSGNSCGIENSSNITIDGVKFRSFDISNVFRSRTANTQSTGISLLNLEIAAGGTSDPILGFYNGAVDNLVIQGCVISGAVTGAASFGNLFLRSLSTDWFICKDNTFILRESSSGLASGAFYFRIPNTEKSEFVNNTFVNETASAVISVTEFGDVTMEPDKLLYYHGVRGGSFDDKDAISRAIVFAASRGLELDFGNGSYSVGSQVSPAISGPLRWKSSGASITYLAGAAAQAVISLQPTGDGNYIRGPLTVDGSALPVATALDQVYGVKLEGSIASPVAVTADVAAGAVSLTVASTSGIVAGDLLLVYSTTEKFPEGAVGATNYKGAIHRVRSITSSTALVLMDGAMFALTAASGAYIRKITPIRGLEIDGMHVQMGGLNRAHNGIRIRYAENCWLRGCSTADTEDTGVRFDHVIGGGVVSGKFSNCNSPSDGTSGVTGTTGYGVCVATATRNVTVAEAVFHGCRHAVAGGGTYPSFGARVVGNTVYGGRSAAYAANYAFDCHEDCWGWTFERNSVHGDPRTGGFTIRGSFTVVAFNTIRNSGLAGIQVQNLDTGGSYSRGNKILSNIIDTPASAGISVGGAVAVPQYAVEVSGNDIQSPGATAGIYATGVDGLVITRNQIRHGAAANVNGIYLNGSAASAGNRCESVQVAENIITAPTGIGIRCAYTDTLNITSNEVAASASQAVNLLSCNGVAVVGGTLEVSAATASGVYIDGSNKVAVSGVTARQTATPTGSSAGVRMLNATADVAVSGGIYSGFATGVLSASPANYITVAGVNARNCTTSVNIAASANTAAAGNL